MHEVSIISDLIESIDRQLAAQQGLQAKSLRLRRGSTFSEDALYQAFRMLTPGTRLEGATLVVETIDTRFHCSQCGHSQSITSDDLVGHMFLCPQCNHVQEIAEAHELELIDMIAEIG
jgi:Zn finger protein HypA/HybF involved in hydrogenase expression